jgi:hypothetical protein
MQSFFLRRIAVLLHMVAFLACFSNNACAQSYGDPSTYQAGDQISHYYSTIDTVLIGEYTGEYRQFANVLGRETAYDFLFKVKKIIKGHAEETIYVQIYRYSFPEGSRDIKDRPPFKEGSEYLILSNRSEIPNFKPFMKIEGQPANGGLHEIGLFYLTRAEAVIPVEE